MILKLMKICRLIY